MEFKPEMTDNSVVVLPLVTETVSVETKLSPNDLFVKIIDFQTKKEEKQDIWKNSPYKDLVKLQSNNVGIVGEQFMQKHCDFCQIEAQVDGAKTKELGGGVGDGVILGKSVEIKTAVQGSSTPSFQHELGETPWKAEFIVFIDVAPQCIYLTIFKNMSEEFYKSGKKCEPYFPTKGITWRKGTGAFKLDTTVKINEDNIVKGYTIRIDGTTDLDALKTFILLKFE